MRNLLLTLFLLFTMAAAMLSLPIAAKAEATIVNPDGSPAIAYQRTLDRSLMPSPDVVVTVHEARCPDGSRPCMIGRDIYLPSYQPTTFLHEMGHEFDLSMTDWLREKFAAAERERRPWDAGANSLLEQFAEAYRLCSRFNGWVPAEDWYIGYDYPVLHQAQVCSMIRNEAARDGFTPNPPRHLVTIGE
jgi:hypothetical protein